MEQQSIYSRFDEILKQRKILQNQRNNEFLNRFDYCLSLLKDEYKNILLESYIDVTYQFWWVDFYCKSSYYRKRIKAITSFVLLFETMYENNIPVRNSFNPVCSK